VDFTLTGLFVYPVKGARGIPIDEAQCGPRGIDGDRRYMLVDDSGRFVTQRDEGRLAQLVPSFDAHGVLHLAIDGVGEVRVPMPASAQLRPVRVWDDEVAALPLGEDVARFLSEAFGRPLALVYMPDATRREVQQAYADPGDLVGFADAFPYLITNEASLAALNAAMPAATAAVPMERFRPNLVVRGPAPFAEDDWAAISVGSLRFELRKPCTRCVVITRDQHTGESQGKEPLRTLTKLHRWQNKPSFGQNALPRSTGPLRLGEAVAVLSHGSVP
jgi:uncharacterized protein